MNVEITPRMIVSDMTAVHQLVFAGAGVAVLPSYLVAGDLASGHLVDALPGVSLPSVEIFVAYPHHRGDFSKIAVLVAELGLENHWPLQSTRTSD
jgi:DNA-binding transcriptional LysR family regulator